MRAACAKEAYEAFFARVTFGSKAWLDLSFSRIRPSGDGSSAQWKRHYAMSELKKDAARRYIVDGAGQRILVRLTISDNRLLEFG